MGRVADEVATTCAAQKGSRTVGRTSPSAPSVGGDSALKRESTIRRWQGGQWSRAASRRTRSRAAGAGRQRRCDDLRCPEGEPDRRADVAIGALSRRRLGAQAGINDSTLAGRPMVAGRQPAHPEACGPEPEGRGESWAGRAGPLEWPRNGSGSRAASRATGSSAGRIPEGAGVEIASSAPGSHSQDRTRPITR